jgi:hypothetical protein
MKIIRKPIEMIAYFPKTNVPEPIKYRLLNEDGSLSTIRINRIISTDLEKLAGNRTYIFTCQSIINDILQTYELKYELSTCKWLLWKV